MVHDDVWIDDYFLCQRLAEGLARYDVIGVAGNRRRVAGQSGWAFLDETLRLDDKANFSGAVAHGQYPFCAVTHYGESPADCELLDGVLLAARKSVLAEKRVSFDPRFDFDFYDMDFCRARCSRPPCEPPVWHNWQRSRVDFSPFLPPRWPSSAIPGTRGCYRNLEARSAGISFPVI
jgi:hypothetical protein